MVRGGGVILHGLQKRQELNGSHGVLLAFCRTADRFLVSVQVASDGSETLISAR